MNVFKKFLHKNIINLSEKNSEIKNLDFKNPEMKAVEAITLSRSIMYGKKWKLFCLDVSFIGWAILSIFTLGIGLIFLIPYINASHVAFFEDAYFAYQTKTGNVVEVEAKETKNDDNRTETDEVKDNDNQIDVE